MNLNEEDLTESLRLWCSGDEDAFERVAKLTYLELHDLASALFFKHNPGDTMQPTALVHETYLRMMNATPYQFANRVQFYGFAGQLMRRALTDYIRSKLSQKRNANKTQHLEDLGIDLPGLNNSLDVQQLLHLDLGLKKLSKFDPRQSRILEIYFFAGLTTNEIAESLDLSRATVKRELRLAKAWMANHIGPRFG